MPNLQTDVVAYVPTPQGSLNAADPAYLQRELAKISKAITTINALLPQAATVEPRNPSDLMVRLARSPWRPIGGTVDRWVYYDAPSASWLAL